MARSVKLAQDAQNRHEASLPVGLGAPNQHNAPHHGHTRQVQVAKVITFGQRLRQARQNGHAHASAETQAAEAMAADRIFGLLPNDLRDEFRALWEEFEAAQTPDARFAKSLDREQPVMANLMSGGGTWTTYNVTSDQLDARVGVKIAHGAPALWTWVRNKTRAYFA